MWHMLALLAILVVRLAACVYMSALLLVATLYKVKVAVISRLQRCLQREAEARRSSQCKLVNDPVRNVTILIPCYLPNEEKIIEQTVEHFLTEVIMPGPCTVLLVYNTPDYMPFQKTLGSWDGREGSNGAVLRVMHVEGSKSKSDNINAALARIDTELVALYDADHRPAANSLLRLKEQLERNRCDCVQGSYNILFRSSWVDFFVDADFFFQYSYFAGMFHCFGVGFFLGTNALWTTSALRELRMCNHLTEDIEISLRALRCGMRIQFCALSESRELPPADMRSLYKQRLRWQQGGDQVFLQSLREWRKIQPRVDTMWCRLEIARNMFAFYMYQLLRYSVLLIPANVIILPIVSFLCFPELYYDSDRSTPPTLCYTMLQHALTFLPGGWLLPALWLGEQGDTNAAGNDALNPVAVSFRAANEFQLYLGCFDFVLSLVNAALFEDTSERIAAVLCERLMPMTRAIWVFCLQVISAYRLVMPGGDSTWVVTARRIPLSLNACSDATAELPKKGPIVYAV